MAEPTNLSFTVAPAEAGERIDKLLVAHASKFTRSQLQSLVKDGHVLVDGQPAKPGWRMKGGETVTLNAPAYEPVEKIAPAEIPLNILFEDATIAVINKPAGMVVHPGAGDEQGTLAHAILARYPEIGEMRYAPKRRGIVHRLDKDTSGVILVARNEQAMHNLAAQFQKRTVEKQYLALLERHPKTDRGRINLPIARDPADRKKMSVQRDGRPAISEFFIEKTFDGGYTLVRVNLLTGRTHQIRVHMAYIGAPIAGDRLYGLRRQRLGLNRQFLHAASLAFDHPVTGERMRFEAPLADELMAVLRDLSENN